MPGKTKAETPVIDYKGMIGVCRHCGQIRELRLGICRDCYYNKPKNDER